MSLSTNGSVPDDEALMARVQNGDTEAFGQLYDRHAVRALRVARAICGDAGRAEDAMQKGFQEIWTRRAQFDPANGSFKAWSTNFVRERAIDSSREPEAEVIALAFFGELSHSEIAALLDLPSHTVKSRMRIELEKLRGRMGVPT